jgi:hypothetical protein
VRLITGPLPRLEIRKDVFAAVPTDDGVAAVPVRH